MLNLPEIDNKSEYEYLWYVGQLKDAGVLDADWSSIADYMNQNFREDEEHYFGESVYRKNYATAKKFFDAGVFDQMTDDEHAASIDEKTRVMQKERMKLQTEKTEYNRWLRENARDELITEKLVNAIATLPPLEKPDEIEYDADYGDHYLLTIADAHYGIEFDLKGLQGETINAYSPEIFEERMWELQEELITLIPHERIQVLDIWEMGDGLQGILRLNSQLMKLRYGILECSIRYADFLANWLNELSKYVYIHFQMMMDSNHNQLRICGAPKNAFADENMSKVMFVLIKERLKNNPNITIIDNPTGFNYLDYGKFKILGIHGEVKDLNQAFDNITRTYDTNFDYLIGAHKHHTSDCEIGRGCETLSVRSIIGVDPYALSINQAALAGANVFVFNDNHGLICDHRIILD